MTTLSIIIPTLNEEKHLDQLLATLTRDWPETTEIWVADGGSTDATAAITRRYTAVHWLDCPQRGRARQMNYAARRASGEHLLFLHADCLPPEGAATALLACLDDTAVVGGSFRLRFDQQGWNYRLLEAFTRWNSPLWTFGDQGIFVRRQCFRQLAGYRDLRLLEDVDLQWRLRHLGRFAKLPLPLLTSARRFEAQGLWRQTALNFLILIGYYAGLSPARLARYYTYSKNNPA